MPIPSANVSPHRYTQAASLEPEPDINTGEAALSVADQESIRSAINDPAAVQRSTGAEARAAAHRTPSKLSYLGSEVGRRILGWALNSGFITLAQMATLKFSRDPKFVSFMGALTGSMTKSYLAEAVGKLGDDVTPKEKLKYLCVTPDTVIKVADAVLDATAYCIAGGLLSSFAKKEIESADPDKSFMSALAEHSDRILGMTATAEAVDFAVHRLPIAILKACLSSEVKTTPGRDFVKPLVPWTNEGIKMHVDCGLRVAANAGNVGWLAFISDKVTKNVTYSQVGWANAALVGATKLVHAFARDAIYERVKRQGPTVLERQLPQMSDIEQASQRGDSADISVALRSLGSLPEGDSMVPISPQASMSDLEYFADEHRSRSGNPLAGGSPQSLPSVQEEIHPVSQTEGMPNQTQLAMDAARSRGDGSPSASQRRVSMTQGSGSPVAPPARTSHANLAVEPERGSPVGQTANTQPYTSLAEKESGQIKNPTPRPPIRPTSQGNLPGHIQSSGAPLRRAVSDPGRITSGHAGEQTGE